MICDGKLLGTTAPLMKNAGADVCNRITNMQAVDFIRSIPIILFVFFKMYSLVDYLNTVNFNISHIRFG